MIDYGLIYCNRDKQNWFYQHYYNQGNNYRYFTFQLALNLLQHITKPTIIETGCQREQNDFGSGMSTSIFAEYVSRYTGRLLVVDNNHTHLKRCETYTKQWYTPVDPNIIYTLSDSIKYLKQINFAVDLIYLDSYDYPYIAMLDVYKEKFGIDHAIQVLDKKTNKEIIDEFKDLIIPCQEHCLKEFQAIEHNLHNKSIVLVDDNDFPGGGKPGLLKPYLIQNGWICLLDFQQTLWVRG